jgi:UDP-N-acetylmuramoyl-L-alanyl-D-glutamate--2,6-diaminopimelate ligase
MPASLPDRQDILSGISGLTADSRAVEAGWLFAALRGAQSDGRAFIPQALDQGAAVVLTDELPDAVAAAVRARARLLLCKNPRRALA